MGWFVRSSRSTLTGSCTKSLPTMWRQLRSGDAQPSDARACSETLVGDSSLSPLVGLSFSRGSAGQRDTLHCVTARTRDRRRRARRIVTRKKSTSDPIARPRRSCRRTRSQTGNEIRKRLHTPSSGTKVIMPVYYICIHKGAPGLACQFVVQVDEVMAVSLSLRLASRMVTSVFGARSATLRASRSPSVLLRPPAVLAACQQVASVSSASGESVKPKPQPKT